MMSILWIFLLLLLLWHHSTADYLEASHNKRKHKIDPTTFAKKLTYVVSVLDRDDYFICGGAILSATVVITAAHCTHNAKTGELTVRAGSPLQYRLGQVVRVKKHIPHHDFKEDEVTNYYHDDIALLILAEKLKMGRHISAVRLATVEPRDKASAFVPGWSNRFASLDDMSGTWLRIVNRKSCQTVHGPDIITNGIICAEGHPASVCYADRGSPLVASGRLVGIVAWSDYTQCAKPRYPGIYTNVVYYNEWIDQNIKKYFKLKAPRNPIEIYEYVGDYYEWVDWK